MQGHRVVAEVDPVLFFELVGHVVDQTLIEVVAAKMGVAVGADDPEHAVGHFEHGDVERAAAEVEDDDLLVLLLVQAVGQRGGGRLVDDPRHFQPGDLAGVLGGLPLGVVKVRRHRDHGLVHLVAHVRFGGFLELAQGERGDFGRRIIFAVNVNFDVVFRAADHFVGHHLLFGAHFAMAASHETFDRGDGARGVSDRLASGRLAHHRLALIGERHNAGRQAVSLRVGDYFDFLTLHHSHDGVRGAEVDSDDLLSRRHN